MSRTFRTNNGLNHGRDDKPFRARCEPSSKHPKGFDTFLNDHGHYGAGGAKKMKRLASKARRRYGAKQLRDETSRGM